MDAPSFLGKGWHFPPTFGAGGREVWTAEGEADVAESLGILLATAQGERVMREDFGCDLNRFVFEEVDGGLRGRVAAFVKAALQRHEPRILVEKVEADSGDAEGLLLIRIVYRVPATNSRFNLVYPFYLNEASQARP